MFDDILDRYVLDRKLRLFVMDAVERIEISVRPTLSNAIAVRHRAHWHLIWHFGDIRREHGAGTQDCRCGVLSR